MSELTSGPIVGTSGDRTLGWFCDWNHQWDSFTPRQNWRDFTLLHWGGEWSAITGRVEATVALLGVSATITYVYDDAFVNGLMRQRNEFVANEGESDD